MKQLKGGFNKVANFDINLQEPKFTCNSANDRVLTLGLELNISRMNPIIQPHNKQPLIKIILKKVLIRM
ncbi:MAG: hypothetical protein IPG21_04145 [Saprospiraceae bacterium]|nr:hypothetical protein [Candidatus Vicinibacter affinis]